MNVFEILNLRSEFEEIVMNYRIPGDRKFGTIENLAWFIGNGRDKNLRKKDFARGEKIANLTLNSERKRKWHQK